MIKEKDVLILAEKIRFFVRDVEINYSRRLAVDVLKKGRQNVGQSYEQRDERGNVRTFVFDITVMEVNLSSGQEKGSHGRKTTA